MTNATRIPTYRALGTTDAITTCQCCGREDLKKTVVIASLDADGNELEHFHFGTSCAAKATKQTVKTIRTEADNADRAAREAARAEQVKRQQEEDAQWGAFLTEATGIDGFTKRLQAIKALGGFKAAMDAFKAAA